MQRQSDKDFKEKVVKIEAATAKAHATRDRNGHVFPDAELSSSPFLTFGYRPEMIPRNVKRVRWIDAQGKGNANELLLTVRWAS